MSLENKLILATAPALPEGFCFDGDWQALVDYIINNATYEFDSDVGNAYYNIGDSEPTADNRVFPWIRTIADVAEGIYTYTDGAWLRYHEVPASEKEVRIWKGTEAELKVYDGGEDEALSNKTGPFWEIDTDLEGRFPLGSNGTYALGATGGAATHTLTQPELPSHHHFTNVPYSDGGAGAVQTLGATSSAATATLQSDDVGSDNPHNNMPPYRAVHFIKRTARVYRRAV